MTRTIKTITVNFVIYSKSDKKVREDLRTIPFKKEEDLVDNKYLTEVATRYGVLSGSEMLVSCERMSEITTRKYYMDDISFYMCSTAIE